MNLLDKLVLALRSAVNDAVGDVVSEDVSPATKEEHALRAMDKAQARLDIMREDLERAEKRGQDDLAARLKPEITDLQATLDKTRKRLQRVIVREAKAASLEQTQVIKKQTRKEGDAVEQLIGEREEVIAKHEDKIAARDELDHTRIADALKTGKKE